MNIKKLLDQSREIWGKQRLNLAQIIIRMGKIFGDICRWERDAIKNKPTHTDEELQKELGFFGWVISMEEVGIVL